MGNNFKILISFSFLVFLGIYLILFFSRSKNIEWLGIYFVSSKDETLHFVIDNHSRENKNCEISAKGGSIVFFKKEIFLSPKEAKKIFIDPKNYIHGEKNSVIVRCGEDKKEIYKYIPPPN